VPVTIHPATSENEPAITVGGSASFEAGRAPTEEEFLEKMKVTATDSNGQAITPVADLSNVDFSQPGEYTAKVSATDSEGNTASLDIPVTITPDVTPPTITGNTSLSYPVGRTVSPADVLADANIKVSDNSVNPIVPTVDLSNVDLNTPGTYKAIITAKDPAGNVSTPFEVTITVTAGDTTPPVIKADEAVRYYVNRPVTPEQFIKDAHVVVTDNSGETIVPSVDMSAVNFTVPGSYVVTINAVDSSGNAATPVSVNVTVAPAPVLKINVGQPTLTYEVGTDITKDLVLKDANITISYSPDLTVTSDIDISAINPNELGSYQVTATADDSYGNHETATLTVNVVDTTAPVIIGKPSVEYGIWASPSNEQFLTDASVKVTDNYDKTVSPVVDLSGVDFNKAGTYTASVSATDSNGNVAEPLNVKVEVVALQMSIDNKTLTYEAGTAITPAKLSADAGVRITTTQANLVVVDPLYDLSQFNGRKVGSYSVTVVGAYEIGRDEINATDTLTINIIDTTLPEIVFGYDPRTPVTYPVGASITEDDIIKDAQITIKDNSDDVITPHIDLASLDPNVEGTYDVGVDAEDSQGNKAVSAKLPIKIGVTSTPDGGNNGGNNGGTGNGAGNGTGNGTGNGIGNIIGGGLNLHANGFVDPGHLASAGSDIVIYQYIIAGLLVIGSSVVLIAKRRKANKSNK